MDPNSGTNPSNPRLDNGGLPNQPARQNAATGQPFTPQPPITAPVIQTPVTPSTAATPSNAPTPINSIKSPNMLEGFDDMNTSSEPKGKLGGKGKTVLAIVGAVIVVVGLCTGAFFVGNTMGKSQGKQLADAEYQKKEADKQRQEAEAQTEESDATLDLGTELIEPQYIDENIEGDIGKQLTASDGLVLKVVNIERNFKTDDPNYKLDSSKELVKVNFLLGNIAKDKVKDIDPGKFYIENSSSARLTAESIASYTDKFDTIKLDIGTQEKGSIVYLVNKDEAPLKFIREQRYRFSGENREVTTRTIINIAE